MDDGKSFGMSHAYIFEMPQSLHLIAVKRSSTYSKQRKIKKSLVCSDAAAPRPRLVWALCVKRLTSSPCAAVAAAAAATAAAVSQPPHAESF